MNCEYLRCKQGISCIEHRAVNRVLFSYPDILGYFELYCNICKEDFDDVFSYFIHFRMDFYAEKLR